ncbi:hypothetical protein HK096_008296 [Nowakowskiella sp. JEL0078]|nr:hypothetical protein HK096_008296 [Nowakowskiella sp. JEL0078]
MTNFCLACFNEVVVVPYSGFGSCIISSISDHSALPSSCDCSLGLLIDPKVVLTDWTFNSSNSTLIRNANGSVLINSNDGLYVSKGCKLTLDSFELHYTTTGSLSSSTSTSLSSTDLNIVTGPNVVVIVVIAVIITLCISILSGFAVWFFWKRKAFNPVKKPNFSEGSNILNFPIYSSDKVPAPVLINPTSDPVTRINHIGIRENAFIPNHDF